MGDHGRLLWLLSIGAEVDPVDPVGVTPLSLASAKVGVFSFEATIDGPMCLLNAYLLRRKKYPHVLSEV